jgi:hypothetical protein
MNTIANVPMVMLKTVSSERNLFLEDLDGQQAALDGDDQGRVDRRRLRAAPPGQEEPKANEQQEADKPGPSPPSTARDHRASTAEF